MRPTVAQTIAKPAETHIADISGGFPAAPRETSSPRPNQCLQVQLGPVNAVRTENLNPHVMVMTSAKFQMNFIETRYASIESDRF